MTTMPADLTTRQHPRTFSDRVAFSFTKAATFFADTFFARRYGHRAIVLETIAAVPGMVGATLQHLKSLRRSVSAHWGKADSMRTCRYVWV